MERRGENKGCVQLGVRVEVVMAGGKGVRQKAHIVQSVAVPIALEEERVALPLLGLRQADHGVEVEIVQIARPCQVVADGMDGLPLATQRAAVPPHTMWGV
jgi:hypothetical protein